ncbi:hypothetical protein B6S12_10395 [Helicobacter valdiviensis]|uniref:Uncharacterized protein n=1 Tax=Helicobacter valdiviensis TaxID=1458358 RepID=A0A2W6MVF0_9HELI|nr:hypothetical protein [Helicobacter valdiviensis]PZT47188.1 hypothetical protein B6S12_10395 [Helicobacter valdiviensis]
MQGCNPKGDRYKPEEITKIINQEIKNFTKLNENITLRLIYSIFPNINVLLETSYADMDNKHYRIASPYFYYYFILKFPDNSIPKELLEEIINANSIEKYNEIFEINNLNSLIGLQYIYDTQHEAFIKKITHKEQFLLYLFNIFDEIEGDLSKKYKIYCQYFRFLASGKEIVDKAIKDDKNPLEVRILYILQIASNTPKDILFEENIENLIEELRGKYKEKTKEQLRLFINYCFDFDRALSICVQNPKLLFLFLWDLVGIDYKELVISNKLKLIMEQCEKENLLKLMQDVFPNFTKEKEDIEKYLQNILND